MTGTAAQIGFQQIGLGGVLKQYKLVVPPNQREYSWEDQEVVTLFQDLAQAIDQGEQSYFLGTIVTIPRSPDNLEVIDGQQRLATTAILLAQMRRYLANRETLIAESINEFLEVIDREKRARVPRLHLNLDDNEFFRRAISDSLDDLHVKRDSHKRISDALREAEHHVNRIVGPHDYLRHGDVLNRWLNFIEHGA